jgi:katanin p60 ATPase-containing subunit A1
MRVNTMAKDVEAARAKASTRDAVALLHRHLEDNGYCDTAETLAREAASSLAGVTVADDISLEKIFLEHERYHVKRHGVAPKLYGRVGTGTTGAGSGVTPRDESKHRFVSRGTESTLETSAAGASSDRRPAGTETTRRPPIGSAASANASRRTLNPKLQEDTEQRWSRDGLGVFGAGVRRTTEAPTPRPGEIATPRSGRETFANDHHHPDDPFDPSRIDFESEDLNQLASVIRRDIVTAARAPRVRWEDVSGLVEAKRILREAVVAPVAYPELFTGLLSPWRGVLLHGPPGTGKTLLARAVATEVSGSTFFNVSASTVVSKYRGDSEKLVRVLFELARRSSPSVVFVDEIDALMCERGGGEGSSSGNEHEASRRVKTELLIQLDGLVSRGCSLRGAAENEASVFLLAATNAPWSLDPAFLRRVEKRVFVSLPDAEARLGMLRRFLSDRALDEDVSLEALALEKTRDFSGSDVEILCKEIAMRPLRRLVAELDLGRRKPPIGVREIGPITAEDVRLGLAVTKPSAANQLERHRQWSERFGQNGG